ncbi:MAG: hypothetical protein WC027_01510 [Candidatus Paceibacterota bacterium]
MDPELKEQLGIINKHLSVIEEELRPTRWKMFTQGIWRAVGYLLGLLIAIALLGWVLNIIGVVPWFQNIAEELNNILGDIRTR